MLRLATLSPSAVVLLVLGCSPGDEEGVPPWTSVRLVDRVGTATIESRFDPSAPPSARPVLPEMRLGDLPRRISARSDGAWASPYLLGRPVADGATSALRLVQVPWDTDRDAAVRVRPDGEPGPDDAWFAIAAEALLAPNLLDDREQLEKLLRRTSQLVQLGRARDGSWSAVVKTPPRTAAVLLVALGGPAPVDDARLEVGPLDLAAAWYEETERTGLSPFVRRIRLDDVVRESLVLGAPGTARFRVRVPESSPTFRTFVADPFRSERGTVTLSVTAETDDGQRHAEVSVEDLEWHRLELDLAPFAGREVDVVLAADGPPGTFGVFGQPEVTGEPRGPLPLDVVVVSLDTVRADRTSVHGGRDAATPALERLARSSVVFDAAISVAPWTLPSHLSIFSGFYPDRHGVTRALGRIGDDVPWLAEELRAAGYRTIAYAASGYVDPQFGFARGFERYSTRDPVNPPLAWARLRPDLDDKPHLERAEESVRQRASLLARLREERDRPLFLFLHTYQAHDYRAPPDVLEAFGARPDEMEALLDGVYHKESPYLRNDRPPPELEATLKRRSRLLYDAALSLADAFVADVVAALEESGRLERTILIVTSDHGEELFDRGEFGHGRSVREELIRIPLVVRVPGLPPRRVADVVSHVDLAPTVRALVGLQPVDDALATDGRDLSPLLRGEALEARPALARGGGRSGTAPVVRALRGPRRKVIETRRGGERQRTSLYDLVSDPREVNDLSKKQPDELDRRLERLGRHVAALRALAATAGRTDLSDELRRTLGELGYLGDD